MAQTWRYEGIALPVGRPEVVATWPFPLDMRQTRWEVEHAEVWVKIHPSSRYVLRWTLHAYDFRRNGGVEVSDYTLQGTATGEYSALPGVTWAEWDHRGRLIYTRDGQLYAGSPAPTATATTMLADFNDQRPYEPATPAWARRW